jgi:hypothetical protein
MSSDTNSVSPSVRNCLSSTEVIVPAEGSPRVARTVAEALAKELCPHASVTITAEPAPASLGLLAISVAGDEPPAEIAELPTGSEWMFLQLNEHGGGKLVASRPHLVYTLFCHLRDSCLDDAVGDYSAGKLIPIALADINARDDLLTGRASFLIKRERQVQLSDIEASFQEMARLGSARVVVNELALPFGYDRGPEGEVYYRFYDYLPDLDQFVETKFNQGIYPPEYLSANLNSLKRLARLADKYGLIPGMEIANPRSAPEALLQRYPFLRGPRVDHPFRCFEPRYALTLAHPAVRWHYAELMRAMLREVPEMGFISTLINDSGSGFEFTSSLYAGRNGGPYIIKEWQTDAAIAQAAAKNVIRYYRLLRDVAHETHPDFRIVTSLRNIAEESGIIMAGIDDGIDLRMVSQRSDVDGDNWKKELEAARRKNSDFVADAITRASEYVLGMPSPWRTHRQMTAVRSGGFSRADVYLDPPYLVPYSVNRDVIKGFQLDPSQKVDDLIAASAHAQVGAEKADQLMAIWQLADTAVQAAPGEGLYAGNGFVWYRFWVRPMVPDIGAIPEADRRYYEQHFLSHFNNPHNVDLAADMLWQIVSPAQCAEAVRRFDDTARQPLDQAIGLAERAVQDSAAQTLDVFVDLRDRLIAYRCYALTLRNLGAWIVGVHGYLNAETDAEKQEKMAVVKDMVASELGNAQALLELWETSDVDFMPLNGYTETMHEYGVNFGDLLRKKIALTEQYGDRLPHIDPEYMWRMPEGSAVSMADFRDYIDAK